MEFVYDDEEVRCGICGKGCFAHSDAEVDECFGKILDSLK